MAELDKMAAKLDGLDKMAAKLDKMAAKLDGLGAAVHITFRTKVTKIKL